MDATPLVICADAIEKHYLLQRFDRVAVEGESLAGFRASVILVTPRVSIGSDWFGTVALSRLVRPGSGSVQVITPARMRGSL